MEKYIFILILSYNFISSSAQIKTHNQTLAEAIEKLRRSLIAAKLKKLDNTQLTNKACVEAIGDICTDAEIKFSCDNMECIFPESPPEACRNSFNVTDAESTHEAIKEVITPCIRSWLTMNDTIFERNPDLPRASPEAVEKLRRALRKVDLKMLDEDKLTNRACVEAIGDICEDSIKKFTCENTACIFPNSTPPACQIKPGEIDAESTHEAIKAILHPCNNTQDLDVQVIRLPYRTLSGNDIFIKPILKLLMAMKNINLTAIDWNHVTNKACVDALGDICRNSDIEFDCYNTDCLFPETSPPACRDTYVIIDAESTHNALRAAINPCIPIENTRIEIKAIL